MSETAARPSSRRRFGVVGAVFGAAVAGVAAGVAAERTLVRRLRERADDPYAREPFGRLPCDESLTVTGPDGVDLHVEVVDPTDGVELDAGFAAGFAAATPAPEPTVVFVHGFCLEMGSFHFQRKDLTRRGEWRAVFYDQPGHGRSGRLPTGPYELTAQADALLAVIDATAPSGPVVLVGHSMGGMTIMAFAKRYPRRFAQQVAGTVLIATSGGRGDGDESGLPELLTRIGRPLLPLADGANRLTGGVIDRARRASTDIAWLLTRRYGFGAAKPSPALVSYVEQTISRTPIDTVIRHLRTLHDHTNHAPTPGDEPTGAGPAVAALQDKPLLLICGDCDPITPRGRSEAIRALLPEADLVVVPDSGHLVLLEHPEEVNAALRAFLEKLG